MKKVVGVRFKKAGKIYYFDPADMNIQKDTYVVVETARGIEFGECVIGIKEINEKVIPMYSYLKHEPVSGFPGENPFVFGFEVLKEIVPAAIKGVTFPKAMRWGGKNMKFARPIRWMVTLLNDNVLEIDLEGIK